MTPTLKSHLPKLENSLFYALLLATFIFCAWSYSLPIRLYGTHDGFYRLLWSCDDAVRALSTQMNCEYSTANIVLFLWLEPALILLAALVARLKKPTLRITISWLILILGIILTLWLTSFHMGCYNIRFEQLYDPYFTTLVEPYLQK